MASCGHFFAQYGCPHCAASRATTVGEHVAAGNMLAQAQLQQQAQANAQMAHMAQAQAQQAAVAEAHRQEELRYRIASWRQTDDGKAYTAWEAAAPGAVGALDGADAQWRAAWIDAVAAQAGPDAMTPRRIFLGSPMAGVLLVIGLLILNGMTDGFVQTLFFFLFIAGVVVAIARPIKQKVINAEAKERRTAVFGFDPLETVPSWAADRSPSQMRNELLSVLQAGPAAYPPARSLPSLMLPLVDLAWPAPMDAFSQTLAARLTIASTEVLALQERAAV